MLVEIIAVNMIEQILLVVLVLLSLAGGLEAEEPVVIR